MSAPADQTSTYPARRAEAASATRRCLIRIREGAAVVLGAAGLAAVCFVVLVLLMVAWTVGSLPADNVATVVSQYTAMVAAVQIPLAVAVAGATIYYARQAGRLNELTADRSAVDAHSRRGDMIEAVFAPTVRILGLHGSMLDLQRRTWRWLLPGPAAVWRELMIRTQVAANDDLAELTAAGARLKAMWPEASPPVNEVFALVERARNEALNGRRDGLQAAARDTNAAFQRIRVMHNGHLANTR